MTAIKKRPFGSTGLEVTYMGFGAAPVGNFLRPISEEKSAAMINRAWDSGMRYFDAAPYCGHGLLEARIGQNLRWRPRNEFVVSTKVGRVLKPALRKDIDFKP